MAFCVVLYYIYIYIYIYMALTINFFPATNNDDATKSTVATVNAIGILYYQYSREFFLYALYKTSAMKVLVLQYGKAKHNCTVRTDKHKQKKPRFFCPTQNRHTKSNSKVKSINKHRSTNNKQIKTTKVVSILIPKKGENLDLISVVAFESVVIVTSSPKSDQIGSDRIEFKNLNLNE